MPATCALPRNGWDSELPGTAVLFATTALPERSPSAENFASAACRPWDCNLPTDQCCRVMISGVVHSGTCMDDCICPLIRHANANPQLRSQSDTMVQYAHPELGCVELDGGIHP